MKTNSFWAIVFGILAGIIIAFFAGLILYATTTGGKTLLINQILILLISFIPLLSAGWITTLLCPKYYIRNTLISGLLLALCFLINNDFEFNRLGYEGWLIVLEIIPITILGGILATAYIKKGNSKANS